MNVPPSRGPARRPPPLPAATPHTPSASVGSGVHRVLPRVLIGFAVSVLGAVTLVALLAGFFVGQRWWHRSAEDVATEIAEEAAATEAQLAQVELERAVAEAKRARSEVEELKKSSKPSPPRESPKDGPGDKERDGGGMEPKIEASPPAAPKPPKKPPKPQRDVFSDIANRRNRLALPPVFLENADAFSAGKINPKLELLAELFVEDIKQCELSVEGREFTETGAGKHELKRKDDDGGCTWNLLTTTATGASQEWGVFRLEGQELKFQWKGKPSVRLQFCRLNIKVGDQAVRCSLNRVEKLTRVPINVEEPFTVPLKCLTGVLRKDDPVRIELQFDGLTSSISVNGEKRNSMKPGEIAEIRVRNPDVKSDDSLASTVAMEIAFRAPQANSLTGSSIPPSLRGEVYGFPRSPIENRRMSLSLNEKSDAMKALRALGTAADVTFSQDHPTQRDWLARWSKVDAKDRERAVEYFRLGWDSFQAQNQNAPKERIESFSKRIKEFPEKDKAQETIKRNAIDDKKLAAAEEYEKVYRFKVSHEAWCEAMKAFLAGELSKGKIHYRVYMDFEGDPIDIAKTDGFPGKA